MNCFEKASKTPNIWRKVLLPAAVFLAVCILFFQGLTMIERSTDAEQYESLKTTLNQSIIHCYATEGFYPPSLGYIEEHYGLTYDHDKFFIDYQPLAANLTPDVTIIRQEGGQ